MPDRPSRDVLDIDLIHRPTSDGLARDNIKTTAETVRTESPRGTRERVMEFKIHIQRKAAR